MSQKNAMFNKLANDINEYLSNLRNQYKRDYSLDIQEFAIKNGYNDNGEVCSLAIKTADYTATVNASIDIKYKPTAKITKAPSELSTMPDLFEGIESSSHKEELKGIYESDSAINKKHGFSKRIIKNMQSILNDIKNKAKTYDEICTAYNVSKKSLNKILEAYSIPSIELTDSKSEEESDDSDDDEDSHLSNEEYSVIEEEIIKDSIKSQNVLSTILNVSIENRARILEMIVNNVNVDNICKAMDVSQDIVTSIASLHNNFVATRNKKDDATPPVVTKAPVATPVQQTSSLDERIMACSSQSVQDSTDESLLSFQKYLSTSKPHIRR